jgi:hypothetical protein
LLLDLAGGPLPDGDTADKGPHPDTDARHGEAAAELVARQGSEGQAHGISEVQSGSLVRAARRPTLTGQSLARSKCLKVAVLNRRVCRHGVLDEGESAESSSFASLGRGLLLSLPGCGRRGDPAPATEVSSSLDAPLPRDASHEQAPGAPAARPAARPPVTRLGSRPLSKDRETPILSPIVRFLAPPYISVGPSESDQ